MARVLQALLILAVLAALPLGLAGCETDAPGVKSNRLQQFTEVRATPPAAADAAAAVLNDLGLRDVTKRSTSVDGLVTGYTAQNTEVEVSIERDGENRSEITVWVGTLGDPDLGTDIITRIQQRLDRVSQ